jgi:four helix bundle protein
MRIPLAGLEHPAKISTLARTNPSQKMNPPAPDNLVSPPSSSRTTVPMFDHEKLHAYKQELRFIGWVTPLIEEAKKIAAGKTREVCDQLDRASLSALLNTAEGNGKRQGQIRAKFFDDARGSATECAGCLDALVAKAVFAPNQIIEGKRMLVEIVSMLCGLVNRFDETGTCRCREDQVEYRVENPVRLPEEMKRKRMRKRKNAAGSSDLVR